MSVFFLLLLTSASSADDQCVLWDMDETEMSLLVCEDRIPVYLPPNALESEILSEQMNSINGMKAPFDSRGRILDDLTEVPDVPASDRRRCRVIDYTDGDATKIDRDFCAELEAPLRAAGCNSWQAHGQVVIRSSGLTQLDGFRLSVNGRYCSRGEDSELWDQLTTRSGMIDRSTIAFVGRHCANLCRATPSGNTPQNAPFKSLPQ
jgi:hypothetical protein